MSVKKEKTYYFDITQLNNESGKCIPVGTYFMQCDHVPSSLEICNYLIDHKNDIFENAKNVEIGEFTYFKNNIFNCVKVAANIYAMISNIRTIC